MKEATDGSFDSDTASGTVIVDVWAPWCGPCKTMTASLEAAEGDLTKSGVRVVKVNVDDCPGLVTKLGVKSVPTLLLFRDGKAVATKIGSQSRQAIMAFASQYSV